MRTRTSFLLSVIIAAALVSSAAVAGELVDLNSAPAAELVTLPGVGAKRAEDIIRYRLAHGFRRKSDLLRIRGIGRRTYLKLKPLVVVRPLRPPEHNEARE